MLDFAYKDRSKTVAQREEKILKATRLTDADKNPCIGEQEMTYKCLNDNDYDRDKCSKYFQNYKNCKDFWTQVIKQRKRQGLTPDLPPPGAREEYIKQYRETFFTAK